MGEVHINYIPYTYGKQNICNNNYYLENDKLLNHFRQNSLNKLSILTLNKDYLKNNFENEYNINNLEYVYSITKTLKENISTQNKYFTISPDHSVSIGSIGAHNLKNSCIIWIDAHADINTEKTSVTKNIHGMPLSVLSNKSKTILKDIPVNYINDSNIFWIGTRDIDTKEYNNIYYKDNIYSIEKINNLGILWCLQDIQNKLQKLNINNIYISFDIDVLDPSIISSVSTPVLKGLSLEKLDNILKWLHALKNAYNIIGIDFVEYDSRYDFKEDYLLCIKLCNEFIKLL